MGKAIALFALSLVFLTPLACRAGDVAATEAARRAQLMAALPADAAKRVFGGISEPSAGPWRSFGEYTKGCIAGAVPLPADGPNWQVMRPARNRAWGSPVLIAAIEHLAASAAQATGWPGLLVGDIGQPRGGPMVTGHASHQIGLDADIWLMPMPDRRLSVEERDNLAAESLVTSDGNGVDRTIWNSSYLKLYETVARIPELARMFANPAIKRELCREAGSDRDWLAKVRPWSGHDHHFHVRIFCPADSPQCKPQPPPEPGDGCGHELDYWFSDAVVHPAPPTEPPKPPLTLAELPAACRAVLTAP